jgi:acetyltransferase-like isoleucine patch superfamily enzyme
MIDMTALIDERAEVDGSVHIGAHSRVWQFATVARGTVLGKRCTVGAGAVLTGPIFGDDCKISSGVVMGPGFLIGNRVFVGPCTVFANDVYPSVSGDGYDERLLRSGTHFAVVVGDDAMIGSHVVILPGVTVGNGAVLAAHSVVSRDVAPGTIWGRDGSIRAVPDNWRSRRMRLAKALAVA